MIEPGRVCIKTSGRDAGTKCVVINILDKQFVEIVSATRPKARKCNIFQLIPLSKKVNPKSEPEINKALGKPTRKKKMQEEKIENK